MQDFASLRVFQKEGGVLRRKILRRCVCFKNRLVYYDARFCIAACVSKTGWCITMQDIASLRVFQKQGGVLRCKILRRCVCFKRGWCVTTQDFASLRVFQKGLVYYDARFCVAALFK